ncbi:hypothetical protein JYU34_011929 [Plutella xylostella]|uniref:Uncharacterized protein n=2 Tax=Plutella xylostella TaxID=51655 RepID=A0ABQ7QHJ4_PLUXY|nr:uncharacterized protein LOC125489685 [Plutella xylostella]KAG7303413.1 hypothetical protein JYU34_011929 [Plutella xylostella]CAG9104870.1 unnamed protein product [Plutella xylostella]
MNNKYTALLLACLVVAGEASAVSRLQAPEQLEGKSAWELQADVNDYVDATISGLIPLMQAHGLDPMSLPDVVEGFSVRPLLVTYSAWLKITQGSMTGLVNVERSGDQLVKYFAKMLRVRVQLQFRNTQFNYNYLVKVMNIGPTGGIRATLSRFVVVADILIDFNNDEVQLQEFSMTDIGRLRIRFTGNVLTDWLLTPVTNVFLMIFDTIIIKVVESNIRSAVQDFIIVINSEIRNAVSSLEAIQ